MLSYWPVIAVTSVLAFVSTVDGDGCPDTTWQVYQDRYCIKAYVNPKVSWKDARKACQEDGADLVQIKDKSLNTFVKGLLGDRRRYWLGISNEDNAGEYRYINGDSLTPYQEWRKDEPKLFLKKAGCIEIIGNKRGKWKAKPCKKERSFICQKDYAKKEKWNNLLVTWGRPGTPGFLAGNYFNAMPRTTEDAVKQGFKKVSDCDPRASWRGSRFVHNEDYVLALLYDVNGYIAGIQTIVPPGQASGYPFANIQPPFVQDEDGNYVLTAYFVDPSTICTTGRNATDFATQGTGTGLYIQNGPKAERDSIRIPSRESDVAQTKWVRGGCMPTMGQHYWYNISENMSCQDFFPVFLLYNKGQLNAFGWAMAVDLPSKRLEHPPKQVFPIFFKPVPKCLYGFDSFSTLHIYLTSNVAANKC